MTTMNNEDPADPSVHEPRSAECLHPRIITYVIADEGPDHGKPAGLWACAECGRKFEPVQVAVATLLVDVLAIASSGELPDGDAVNTPTLLWAEEWARRLAEKEQPN